MTTPSLARQRPQVLIGSNIVGDAFGTALYIAGIGFFGVRLVGAEPGLLLASIAIGGVCGIVATYPAAALSDRVGTRSVLIWVQCVQAVTFVVMTLAASPELFYALCLLGGALGRILSGVRGALGPAYLTREEFLPFKARVRSATLVAAAIGAATAGVLGAANSSMLLRFVPGGNALSYAVALAMTLALPPMSHRVSTNRSDRPPPFRPDRTVLAPAVTLGLMAAVAAAVESSLPVIVSIRDDVSAFTVTVAAVTDMVVAIALQWALARWARDRGWGSRRLLGVGLGALLAGFVMLWSWAASSLTGPVSFLFIVALMAATSIGLVFTIWVSWELQYLLGPDRARARVVAIFAMGLSLGTALGPALGSVVLFQSAIWAGAVTVTVAITCLAGLVLSVGKS